MGPEPGALRERWYKERFFGPETFADHLRSGAESFPETTMHFVGGPLPSSIRLDEMYARSRRLGGGLAELGLRSGDVVAIWVPNWLEGALTYQAALMLGCVVVPIIHIYGPREVGFILRQSGARVLVMPDRWRNIDYRERFDAITDIASLEHVVLIGEHGPLRREGDAVEQCPRALSSRLAPRRITPCRPGLPQRSRPRAAASPS